MNVNFNPNVAVKSTTLEALESKLAVPAEKTAAKAAPSIFQGENVTVSGPFTDLDKLLATLRHESTNASEDTRRTVMDNTLAKAIAMARNAAEVSEKNKEALDKAEELAKQKDVVDTKISDDSATKKVVDNEITQLKNTLNQQETQVNTLTKEIEILKGEIEKATDPKQKAALQKQLKAKQGALATANAAVATTKNSISQKTTVSNNLAKAIGDNKALSDKLGKDITAALASIKDPNVLLSLARALKMDAADLLQFLEDYTEEERGVEEEKHLEENDPLRLIRESIINHKEELLDEISEKSQNTTLGA